MISKIKEKLITVRNRIRRDKEKWIEELWSKRSLDEIKKGFNNLKYPHRQFLVKKISLFQPNSILEIGCGYGPNLFWLAKKFPNAKIKGIDINAKEIEIGSKFLTKKGISNVELLVGKADELDYLKDKSFDVIFTDAVLVCIGPNKINNVVQEMVRIAKKALILVEWHSEKLETYNAHVGVWERNYINLLKQFVNENQIHLTKITKELRSDKNWVKLGYIIEVTL